MKQLKLLWKLYNLKRHEKFTWEQMQILQSRKLTAMLQYAWDHSDYYRTKFENEGISREQIGMIPLSSYPTIDKKDLLNNFNELITIKDLKQEDLLRFDEQVQVGRTPYMGKYHVVHSSGSTGKPGYFLYDERSWEQMLLGIIRGALWNISMPQILKLLISKPRILYIAATDGRYGGAMAVGDGIDGVGASQMYLDIKTPLSEWEKIVVKFRPNIVIGYPSAIKILAELVEEKKIPISLYRIISCGEPLCPGMRILLEKTFHVPVINFYGSSESLAMGIETGDTKGMLLFDDLNVIEIEQGEMYLTSLYNFAQPLIRYRISDKLEWKDGEKDSPFSKVKLLLSRQEDVLWFDDGAGKRDFLHPLAVEGFCINGLLDYQFRQTAPDAFEMLAEVPDVENRQAVRAEMLKQMKVILEEKQLTYVQFYVKFVDEILPDIHTGKKALIVSSPVQREVNV